MCLFCLDFCTLRRLMLLLALAQKMREDKGLDTCLLMTVSLKPLDMMDFLDWRFQAYLLSEMDGLSR